MQAVYDHGVIEGDTIRAHYDEPQEVLDDLGGSASTTTTSSTVLEREGVEKFEDSWNELIDSVTEAAQASGDTGGKRHVR